MLGPDTTSSKRADLLSLGRESDYIHQMISLYSTEVKEDANVVKKSEKSIVEIRDKIEVLNTISDIEDKFNSVKDIIDKTIDSKKVMHDIESLIKNLENCQQDILVLNSVTEIHNFNEEVKINNQSMLNDIISMGQELRNIEKTIDSLKTISELKTIDNIEIKNIDESLFNELESNGNEIKQLQSNFTKMKNKMRESSKEKPQEGKVVAVGSGARTEDGKIIPMDVKVGDLVLFGKWSGTEVKIDGIEYSIMKESDIMGISKGKK
jgi:chaperonin GroES